MKRFTLILSAAAVLTFVCAQDAIAFPGQRMSYRAAHFAQKVAYKIDNHVVHPVTRGVARRLR